MRSLQPADVWAHFGTLCEIPRPSKHEDAVRRHLLTWAQAQEGLSTTVDPVGNLLVRKPASTGRENAPALAMQCHLDMVCQKNASSTHDFFKDPIRPVLKDGWVEAPDTTLGADNGMGVAMMLAVLGDPTLTHGPIEALFTVDEEAGMGGAQGLASDLIQARLMLNLDTEEWGEFYLGCAGGMDVLVERPGTPEPRPAGMSAWTVSLSGLRGGHSGVNIHEERGNAIKLLVRILQDLLPRHGWRLSSLQGGTARNALPREAFATIAINAGQEAALMAALAPWQLRLTQELTGVENGISLTAQTSAAGPIMSLADQTRWLNILHAAPHGVRRMSQRVKGVVETSNNLGMVTLSAEHGACNFMVRSLIDSGSQALADEIVSLFALGGMAAQKTGQYPGWTPNPDSPLLALCQHVYEHQHGHAAQVQVIHAGLECGIIAAKYPGIDIVSFGPTIRGAHAPGERVEVASVARTWELLKSILSEVAS